MELAFKQCNAYILSERLNVNCICLSLAEPMTSWINNISKNLSIFVNDCLTNMTPHPVWQLSGCHWIEAHIWKGIKFFRMNFFFSYLLWHTSQRSWISSSSLNTFTIFHFSLFDFQLLVSPAHFFSFPAHEDLLCDIRRAYLQTVLFTPINIPFFKHTHASLFHHKSYAQRKTAAPFK